MNALNPSYYDRVRYTLRNITYSTTRIVEPIGWNEDEKKFKRSNKSHGIFTNLSSNLKFHTGQVTLANGDIIDGGFDYIRGVYKQQGVNGSILLIKEEKHPQTDKWQEAYRGYLFFPSPMIIEDKKISIKFKESSFYNSLLARRSAKLELDRLTTMDGADIAPLSTEVVSLPGRDVFILSTSELNSVYEDYLVEDLTQADPHQARALPLEKTGSGDDSFQTIVDFVVPMSNGSGTYQNGVVGSVFYAFSDKDRIFKNLSISIDADFSLTSTVGLPTFNFDVRLDLVTYENGAALDVKDVNELDKFITTSDKGTGSIVYENIFENYEVLEGESLCLVFHVRAWVDVNIVYNNLNLSMEEDSFDDTSPKQAKFLLPFEALERLIYLTTGEENALVSNILGRTDIGYETDGIGNDACFSGITHGLWIRGFDAIPDTEENKFRPLTMSFRSFEEDFSTLWDTGYGIERKGLTEKVRFEERKYFYQKVPTIFLPNQAKKVKRTVAVDYMYNTLEFGFKKPSGDNLYEEDMGLDEYNIRNSSSTPIIPIEKEYKKIAPDRGDSYAIEFARRQSIVTDPTKDTRFDNDKFLMDLKRGPIEGGVFEQRLWPDDFAKAPTGVYSPDTAQNLRFSPANIRTRHGWWIRSGMDIYKEDYIRFASPIGNSNLSTQLIGENEIKETDPIQIKDLESPYFEPWIVEFEHEATTEILQNVQAKTLIDGENVLNYYGLIEFLNEDLKYEYGYLLELKPNKQGKWKLLKSSRRVSRASVNPDPPLPPITDVDGFNYELNMEIDG